MINAICPTDQVGCLSLGCHLRVELRRNVGGVADDSYHHGPLDGQLGDHQGGDEEAGDDEGGVDDHAGPQAQVVHRVDGGLQLGHRLESDKQEKEGD